MQFDRSYQWSQFVAANKWVEVIQGQTHHGQVSGIQEPYGDNFTPCNLL